MAASDLKLTALVATNVAGVRAVGPPDAVHGADHASAILGALALKPDSAASEALRARIMATPWPADARIVPHLVPQIGVTHLLTPRKQQLADTSYTSNNWAGSTIPGTWTDAVGIWRVPTVSIPETPAGTNGGWDSSSWVGIDGTYGSNDVLQAGLQQSVASNGSTTYVAWYEWFAPKVNGSPGYIYQTNIDNMEIQPGDEVFAGIHYRNGKGLVMFGNTNRGHYFTIEIDPPPGASMTGNSVEWIMEAPNTGEPGTSLPRFTPVVFTAAMASSAVPGGDGDPAKGDTTNIWAYGRSLTNVILATDAVTITRANPPWQTFTLAPGGSSSAHGIAAVPRIPGSMELWYVGPNGSVQDRYWYDARAPGRASSSPPPAAPPRPAGSPPCPGSRAAWRSGGSRRTARCRAPTGTTAAPGAATSSRPRAARRRPAGSPPYPGSRAAWSCGSSAPTARCRTATGTRAAPGRVSSWLRPAARQRPAGSSPYPGSPAAWNSGMSRPTASVRTTTGTTPAPGRVSNWLPPAARQPPAGSPPYPGSPAAWNSGTSARTASVQDTTGTTPRTWKGFELAPAGSASTTSGITAVSRIPTSMELWYVAPNGVGRGPLLVRHRHLEEFRARPGRQRVTDQRDRRRIPHPHQHGTLAHRR